MYSSTKGKYYGASDLDCLTIILARDLARHLACGQDTTPIYDMFGWDSKNRTPNEKLSLIFLGLYAYVLEFSKNLKCLDKILEF
jgi:hypothetical protein